jgi:hypothetical protein
VTRSPSPKNEEVKVSPKQDQLKSFDFVTKTPALASDSEASGSEEQKVAIDHDADLVKSKNIPIVEPAVVGGSDAEEEIAESLETPQEALEGGSSDDEDWEKQESDEDAAADNTADLNGG